MLTILIFIIVWALINVYTGGRFGAAYMKILDIIYGIAAPIAFLVFVVNVKIPPLPNSPILKDFAGLLIIPLIIFNVWAVRAYMKGKKEKAQ